MTGYTDFYGKTFNKEDILNRDCIDFIESKSIDEYTDAEISSSMVLITDEKNGNRLYLLSDLEQILQANYYCRLEDPYTRKDILNQIPDFKNAIDFEQHAAHYNALILNKHPDFITLLKTYAAQCLNIKDEFAEKDVKKNNIAANKSEELDKFYDTIANLPDEKRTDFFSLFITNRRPHRQGQFWTFPAKWDLDETNLSEKDIHDYALKNDYYKPFPHRNVLIADLISDPEDACMHSWGMDVLHLLLTYHFGTNKSFSLFNADSNYGAYKLEMALRSRIEREIKPGSLNPDKGRVALDNAKSRATDQLITKLEQSCANYLEYILQKLDVKKGEKYPLPEDLAVKDHALLKKYKAVYELYVSLKLEPGQSKIQCLSQFVKLFNDKERQETIAQHRDNMGIRLLNFVFSLLTLGIKNLMGYPAIKNCHGFWNSKGANLNEDLETLLEGKPQLRH